MKVQNLQLGSSIKKSANPSFGNYVIDNRINKLVGQQLKGSIGTLYKLGGNSGENLNNITTAAGTAFVAPIFIRYNPLSKDDPKLKAYSAWRQPLSAVLALGVQLPAMAVFNNAIDKWAASGKIGRIDLRAKPPTSVVKGYATELYKQQLREYLAAGNKLENFANDVCKGMCREEYIKDLISDARNNIFYAKKSNLRELVKHDRPITTRALRDETGKVIDWFHPTKLHELSELEFVKPDELTNARKSVYPRVLEQFGINPKEKKLFDIKIDWKAENPQELLDKMKSGELEVPENLRQYKDGAIKSALKKMGVKFSDFKKALEETAEKTAIEKVQAELQEEAATKFSISKEISALKARMAEITDSIYKDSNIKDKARAIFDKEKELVDELYNTFEQRHKASTDEEAKKVLSRAASKIKSKALSELREHGETFEEVLDSVKVKKWLRAEINRRESVFANFKKLSGLIYGLAILPLTCGLLNWAYPRFMEKCFPSLCNAKKEAKAKEGK